MKIKKGPEMWEKAKKLIPGGTQLLSKRAERFLPGKWPSYFNKAKGIEIEDLDGNILKDFSIMGVGSCILGYADDDVNNVVKKVIDDSSMCTLNSKEEVELAELLLNIHPWAKRVRYARTGGEIMAIAVRIARAASGNDKVAFCGYHGWHDWYISSNLSDDSNLDGHLLPGLAPKGIPRGLIKTAFPFGYNNINELQKIVKENKIGVIVVEPLRHKEPTEGFLEKVREIANEEGAVLIFDEITSGWREMLGGVHLRYGVIPDIVVYGKAISNGFPMAVALGKEKIMETAQDTFISSTYWTERIGPAAAIATINKLKNNHVAEHIHKIGGMIGNSWKELAKKHELNVEIHGPNSLITFEIKHEKKQSLMTIFTQEMLKRGYLASASVYVSYSHNKNNVTDYMKKVDEVFEIIKSSIDNNNIEDILEGPIAYSGFKRLT